ncbi:phosphate acetyltransferase [Chlamydiota bacterium]
MFLTDDIRKYLKNNKRKIALGEATDNRVIEAAKILIAEGLVELVLVGPEAVLREKLQAHGREESVEIIDPATFPEKNDFINQYYDLRKHKGISVTTACEYVTDPVFFTTMLVKNNIVDGAVSGNVSSSAKVIKAAIQIIGRTESVQFLSSCFIMMLADSPYGSDGTFIFADCGLIPFPDAPQLAEIALLSAKTMKGLIGHEPKIAFLSFSTHGSAKHESITNIREAVKITREKMPHIICDGELQLDAAIVPAVGKIKAPESPVAGNANILIFPDLNSGNIGYKITERLAHGKAYGPIIQGLKRPCNDLSRGCSSDDIVTVVAITALQAINNIYTDSSPQLAQYN